MFLSLGGANSGWGWGVSCKSVYIVDNYIEGGIFYSGRVSAAFFYEVTFIINDFNGDIIRDKWGGTGYNVAGGRTSSSEIPLFKNSTLLHEKLDFLRFLVSNLFKRFCLLFYQVLPDIFTLNEDTLKLFYPVIAMLILTIGNWQTEKSTSLYTNKKIVAQIRKYRKLKGRPQILFIAPKVLIIFYILLSYESKHSEKDRFECLKNSKRHFFNENFLNFCKTTNLYFLNQQASAFALSQMKIQNCNKFLHILLLLSGDVELNPGWAQLDENTFSCFKERGLHFIHLNINSVLPKVDELRLIVKKSNAAVIGLTETKLDDSIEVGEIEIEGYSLERCDRNRKGGGVACYVRNDISFNVRENFSNEIENIFVDILLPKTKPILVGIVYRPPDQSGFIESLNEAISDTHSFDNQEVYIMGDLNIDLKGKPPLAKSYKEFCSLHGLTQIIDSPTRITEETSTLIDHIMTNSKEKIKQFGVLDVSLSDHQAIYFTRKALKQKSSTHKYITIRSMKNYSKPLWLDKLKSLQYPDYSNYDDVDTAYADFIEKTSTAISEIAPFKKLCVKASTSEWVDEEVLEGINKRNKLFQKFKRSGLYEDNANYKKARNDVQNLIKNKKRNFFSNKLTENIGKPKELWKTLRKLGVPSKEQSTSTISLKRDGEIRFDSKSICKIFKDFFANLSTNLLKDLPAPTNLFGIDSVKKYYSHNINLQNNFFSLQPTTKEVIQKLLEELNSAKAVGIDNIGGKFLKDGAPILADPITKLCNLSIILSKFPKECKIAKLKPLYKKGSKLEAKNYRPISLLPLVSKIFEKIIHTQTQHFLDVNKILYKFQSGFRQNHSTDTSLSYLNDRILGGLDEGLFTGMILIDLQKAFDTIDHDIFLKKAKCMGFSESAIKWYKSYLEDRYFVVNVAGENSEKASLNCGVPQGSVLGPLIFLMYVNDMVQAVKCDLYLYADDSCLVCRGKDINAIEDTLNRNFNSLCDWFIDNRLSIHFGEDKTKSIIFGSKRRLKDTHTLAIRRGDIEIKQHKEVKYLGCIFDCNTSGEAMALKVLNKVNSRLRFLYRKQAILNGPLRRLLCNALIQPHFDYASQAWYPNLTKTLSIKLQRAQNKCIRFCLNLDNRAHLDKKEFKDINWLPVKERVAQRIRVTAFNFFNGTSPLYMSEIFIPHETVQATRNSKHRFKVPLKKTNMGQNSLSYLGPKLWNDLPSELKLSKSKNIFKHKIKSAYFEDL